MICNVKRLGVSQVEQRTEGVSVSGQRRGKGEALSDSLEIGLIDLWVTRKMGRKLVGGYLGGRVDEDLETGEGK